MNDTTTNRRRLQKEWFEHKLAAEKPKGELLDEIRAGGSTSVLLDSRGRDAFAQGHLPGARSLPLEEVDALAATLDRSREHVVYCWHVT